MLEIITRKLLYVSWVYCILYLCRNFVQSISRHPIVLIVSTDAFRHDYVEGCLTPTIKILREKGVYAPYMKNVFPTKTFPNHHSIATGVYPEIHGVLDSQVYISKIGCSNRSVVGYSYEMFHYNDDILPIWTLNQLAGEGRHSGVMMWPGGEFPYGIKDTAPTFSQKKDFNISFQQRVDTVMSWLTHCDTPANLIMLYMEEPDLHGHAFGIDSAEICEQIKRVDRTLEYLHQKLQSHNLQDLVNVFVLSDHGMITLEQENIINLDNFVDRTLYIAASLSPVLQIFPLECKKDIVMSGLLKAQEKYKDSFDVFLRDEIPDAWHYSHNNRTPPVLVVAREGYAFQDFYGTIEDLNRQFNIKTNPENKYGIHGYSNDLQSMFPIFFAWGPLLREGVKMKPFNSVELYSLWAYILELKVDQKYHSAPSSTILFSLFEIFNGSHTSPTTDAFPEVILSSTQASFIAVKSAATWIYWGIIVLALILAIFGVIAYYFRYIRFRNVSETSVYPTFRTTAESQSLLTSDDDDNYMMS